MFVCVAISPDTSLQRLSLLSLGGAEREQLRSAAYSDGECMRMCFNVCRCRLCSVHVHVGCVMYVDVGCVMYVDVGCVMYIDVQYIHVGCVMYMYVDVGCVMYVGVGCVVLSSV